MPQITGRKIAPDDEGSVTASLRDIGDSMFKPIDPVARERALQIQNQNAARANAADALQRGDLREYVRQGLMGGIPIADASGYTTQAGFVGSNGNFVGADGQPIVPRYVPQPPAPVAAVNTAAPSQAAPQPIVSSPWS
jgi:hypothetical protein